jgi:hypothetical protein
MASQSIFRSRAACCFQYLQGFDVKKVVVIDDDDVIILCGANPAYEVFDSTVPALTVFCEAEGEVRKFLLELVDFLVGHIWRDVCAQDNLCCHFVTSSPTY